VFLVLVVLAMALVLLAFAEMQYNRRRGGASPLGLPLLGGGVAGVIVGIVVLHQTDGVSGNVLGAAIIAAGTIVGLVGYGFWRFEPVGDRGSIGFTPDVTRWLGIGVAGFAGAIIVAAAMDAYDEGNLFFPFTHQGLRATLALVLVTAGAASMFIAMYHARRVNVMTRSAVLSIFGVLMIVLAFFVRSESESVKFRSEAFSVMLGLSLVVVAWVVLGLMFSERDSVDNEADSLGSRLMMASGVAVAVAFVVKLLFTLPEEIANDVIPAKFSVRTVWFVGFTAVAVFVLGRTRFGSWTFAVGGNKEAARQVGVPAARTKTQLFMLVSGAAWLVGMLLAFRLNTIQANTGNGEEFEYIIAAVVGGTLLTGGYGTALGGALGAIIIAEATLGIPSARWNSDWRFLFLGVTLLLAVLANRSIRTKAEGLRR
jgi:ribose/xylose/arabinose/galactoside ABC-type transport system permease subunit